MNNTPGKREQIIRAATELLLEENYANMKTAAIAKKAGIAEGTIYRYFASKREIFLEVLNSVTESLGSAFMLEVVPELGLKSNLNRLAEKFYLQQAEISGLYRILYKAFSEVEDPEIRKALGQNYQQGLKVIQEILQRSLEGEKVKPSSERLVIVTMFVWGIGDMMWKNHMFETSLRVGKKIYTEFANTVYEMIVGGN